MVPRDGVGNRNVVRHEETRCISISHVVDECCGVFVRQFEKHGGYGTAEGGGERRGGEIEKPREESLGFAEGLATLGGSGEEEGLHVFLDGAGGGGVDAANEG